ncbi:hypothetical protein [Breoghania sp. L-A4]|uniref:hypothetical protein n=1 Tax=Breoghania sp. L-A4 TaxID=2304600 RepID=UPI0019688C89|nr:hypothetical protein [Breoghania sp. L-A4]
MADELDALLLDLVEWVAEKPRAYADVMDAWRTSCPRLTVWETARDEDFVTRVWDGHGAMVEATPKGLRHLAKSGRATLHSGGGGDRIDPVTPRPA